ncbi:aminotransferase class V-fold PLP-dependent enzyme [Pseudonocardia thermophila]|jgi:Selenocysteine lyase|uniref:aminotransferase class V-fold PLP-dependent enzyme n=1 Tax=Pseudonocardia thermophila TaxID=1848 RepID=UPI00248DF652|nr:aminotransferase class V-fold PLP-dependent enzyme [Pseudonocardia thermophila]
MNRVSADGVIDVAAERRRTLGAALSHHFNSAGAALPSSDVLAAVVDHLRLEERLGGYEAAALVKDATEAAYSACAALVGAQPEEIALFDSASTALRVLLDAVRPAPGTRLVAARSTYVSHALHLMTLVRERGSELVVVPTDDARRVDLGALTDVLADGRPSIVTVAHVPTSSGLDEPVADIGRIARAAGATYLLDATQTVGHLRVDVDEIGCDALVTTGRKFLRGPRGTAFAYIRRSFAERLLPTAPDVRGSRWSSGDDWEVLPGARRFETWEASVAARLGLGRAVTEVLERGIDATAAFLCGLAGTVRARLAEVPGIVPADPADARSGIVTFTVDGVPAADVVRRLAERNVRVVAVPAAHGQWDLGDRGIASVVRASVHVYNDHGDVDALVRAVAEVAKEGVR